MDADLGLSSASALAGLIARKELASSELLDHYLQRIERLNPAINAVCTLDVDRARALASAADAATARGDQLGPLHGLPITVKDAIATEGIRSTGGATELANHVPGEDAPVVAAVKAAGAIVFGKTNLPRWSGDAQAFNTMFGTTNNPWDLTRGPGGSSGGASAAVAAGLTSFELGTDIGGSVRMPSHFAGVCGHKPSFGVVPQLGYLDHTTGGVLEADVNVFGPLARSVADLERIFDVVAEPTADRAVGWRLALPGARAEQAKQLRVAAWLDDTVCPVSADIATALEATVALLEGAGVPVDRAARPDVAFEEVWQTGLPLISAATTPARTAEEWATQLAQAVAAETDAGMDPVRAMRAKASVMTHRDWLFLDERRQLLRRKWAAFFERFDVLLCPVSPTAAFPHTQEGNVYTRTIDIDGATRPYVDVLAWTAFIGFVYLPVTVVPVGLTGGGLPVGIQVVAPYLEDRTALQLAGLVEQLTGGYQPPPLAQLSRT
ncbi:MAG: amidase [Acidimicrobiales bacterium]